MICRCGHPISAHGDRALFPACEGTHDVGPLLSVIDGTEFIKQIPRFFIAPCECKGFQDV